MFDEDFKTAWQLRYGTEPGFEIPEIARFLSHRSVRSYREEPVSDEIISSLVAAAQSAATSSNLQLWSVITIQDPERRAAIAKLCADQRQIHTAGVYFAFLADVHRLKYAAEKAGQAAEALDFSEFYTMAIVDAALAAERMVCAAEALGLGICYIGALRNDPQGVKELLNLPRGVFGVFGLTVGWPKEPMTAEIKPRLSQEAVWFKEQYNPTPNVEEYDERASEFYRAQNMSGDATWSMRSGRRADESHLTGREVLKKWLEEQGFNLR